MHVEFYGQTVNYLFIFILLLIYFFILFICLYFYYYYFFFVKGSLIYYTKISLLPSSQGIQGAESEDTN